MHEDLRRECCLTLAGLESPPRFRDIYERVASGWTPRNERERAPTSPAAGPT